MISIGCLRVVERPPGPLRIHFAKLVGGCAQYDEGKDAGEYLRPYNNPGFIEFERFEVARCMLRRLIWRHRVLSAMVQDRLR